jgi:formylglycine-generating enzyme required for sulfatase activity
VWQWKDKLRIDSRGAEHPGSLLLEMAIRSPRLTLGDRRKAPTVVDLDEVPVDLEAPHHRGVIEFATDEEILQVESWASPSWASSAGRDEYGLWAAFAVAGVEQRMRWIPPGRFQMGSPETEEGRYKDEGLQHEVTLTKGFWLGQTPCTQDLWQAVMGKNPSHFKSLQRPVERVSWEECKEFYRRLQELVPAFVGKLPTEAQWEYACRAGTETATWKGDLEILGQRNAPRLDKLGWYGGNSGQGFDLETGYDSSDWEEKQYPHTLAGTRKVGLKYPNPWGLYDMLGNVLEWCEDSWDFGEGYSEDPRVDPLETHGSPRVFRGGSWASDARDVRAAYRYGFRPGYRGSDVGFRLSRGPQE